MIGERGGRREAGKDRRREGRTTGQRKQGKE